LSDRFLRTLIHGVAGTESSSISQKIGLMSANVGDMVVLRCFNAGDEGIMFSWYKQTFGNVPQLISTIYKYGRNATFYHEFKNNPRFSVEGGQGKNHLMIADVELSDSGTYYCGSDYGYKVEFGQGFILIIKDLILFNLQHLLQRCSREMKLPGNSVTLNCTIHTETCAGEHSVYWFRHGSGESHPGIMYTHGERSDQCVKSLESVSPAQSCVYNLPKRNLSLSDSGTYYCAVASCGEILFGNGTNVDPLLFVYCLGVALAFAFILIILLACIIYKMKKTTCLLGLLYQIVQNVIHLISTKQFCSSQSQDADSLHYAALPLSNKKNRSRRQRGNMEEETVVMYSGIRQ
uniref:Ig-like domain-containing protein n=1 Tax=Oncorhynchus mykiss TaxID=8022 RepID=A0A8C7LVG6_ONCMY